MSPNQKSENTKPFGLTPSISRPANACQTSSKSEEMKRWVLATLLWKRKPALIPIVGIRVREKHTKAWRRRSSSTQHRVVLLSVQVQR